MQIPSSLPSHLAGPQRAGGHQPPVSFPSSPQPPGEVFTPSGERPLQTRSGLKGMWRQDQTGVALQATLPAGGGLLPVNVLLEGSPAGSWAARVGEDEKPVAVGSDGRVYVELEPGAPSVVFDPRNLDYGLASGARPTPTGWQRDQMELIDQNGVRKYVFNEQTSAVGPGVARSEFTEVRWDQRQLTAQRVLRTSGEPASTPGLKSYLNGPDNGEVAMGVRLNPDNSLTVSPPTLGQMASTNAVRLLFGDVLAQKQKGAAFTGTFMPFSAMPQGSLFPVLIGGQPPSGRPPAAPPPPLPAPPPPQPGGGGLMDQLGLGGQGQEGGWMDRLGLDGLFGGGQRPPAPAGPPPSAPVSFGPPVSFPQPSAPAGPPVSFPQPSPPAGPPVSFQPPAAAPDPMQALSQKYPGCDPARLQAAWTLSGGNLEKAEQILQQFGA